MNRTHTVAVVPFWLAAPYIAVKFGLLVMIWVLVWGTLGVFLLFRSVARSLR